ncbi:hypothetical protein J6590_005496 [Homalodisca vitripennis]|nr:hypothetical protein J6590_005496 [Homalodisca vitripennis]
MKLVALLKFPTGRTPSEYYSEDYSLARLARRTPMASWLLGITDWRGVEGREEEVLKHEQLDQFNGRSKIHKRGTSKYLLRQSALPPPASPRQQRSPNNRLEK